MAATTLAVPYAAVEGAKALYNVTDDEMDAMRRYVADWSKNSTLIPVEIYYKKILLIDLLISSINL